MDERGHCFVWRNCVFLPRIENNLLTVEWIQIQSPVNSANRSSTSSVTSDRSLGSVGCLDNSELESKLEAAELSQQMENDFEALQSPLEKILHKASLNLDKINKAAEIIAVDYSFDAGSICNIPVILLKCESKSNDSQGCYKLSNKTLPELKTSNTNDVDYEKIELLLIGVKEGTSIFARNNCYCTNPTLAQKCKSTKSNGTICSNKYSLVHLRTFLLEPTFNLKNTNLFRLISNFRLLMLDDSSMTLNIFYQDFTTFLTTTVKYELIAVMTTLNSCTEIKILNIFNDDDYNTSQALISYNELGIKKCACLQLSLYDKPEQSLISKSYTITTIPSETFFATDYIHILKGVQVLSFCIEINQASKVQPLSSITCILTATGYILKFVDSVLTACISITANCEAVNWTEGVGEYTNIKMINLTSSSGDDKTAVQINSICYLISWNKEKVVKYWSSVLTINSCDFQHCGFDLLVVVLLPSHCEPTEEDVLVFPSLKELDVVVVEGDKDFENDMENEISITGRQLMKKEHLVQPQCAVTALLSRKKTCESALRTSELMLRSKVAFVTEVWHQMSRFNVHQQGCRMTSQPTLVPIIKGSVLLSGDCMERKPYTNPLGAPVQHLSFEKLWTRSVYSQLVVGLCVTNVSTKPLSGIHLKLIPSSSCTAHCVESFSKTIKSGNATCVSPCSSNDKRCLETTQQRKVHLCPGQSEQLTCSVELSQSIIRGHLKLFCFISCLENDHLNCQVSGSVSSHRDCYLAGRVQIFCREVVINLEDFILGKMAISCTSEKKISNEDLQALDCIQISTCLQVTSLFSSARQIVKCLEKHKAFLCLQEVGQYIFTGNHQLELCRVQVLEQTSNHMVDIVTYTKSDYETLNVIQLLHSILPDDFTITLKSSNKEFQNLRETVLKEVEAGLQSLRQCLQNECHSNI